jgi:6-phosphogluconolactonase
LNESNGLNDLNASTPNPEIKRYPNIEALSEGAAEFICTLAETYVQETGRFTIVLAGGKTPKRLYGTLGQPPFNARMPWSDIRMFWGDERCVTPDHPDSNFGMAFRTLISSVPIPAENIHRIPAEMTSPEKAAEAYEAVLRKFFEPGVRGDSQNRSVDKKQDFPVFDLILLGVGEDGHTASLFSGDQALKEHTHWVTAVGNPRGSPRVPRVTLTLPVLNRARCVLFLVTGTEKQQVVRLIMSDPDRARQSYPAARVRPQGRLVWLLDAEALG